MEAITHFFSGIFVMAILQHFIPTTWLVLVLLVPLGILLHFFIDAIVFITFHTRTPRLNDKIWVAWHGVIIIGSVLVAIYFTFFMPYLWALIVSNIPDLYDWVIMRTAFAIKKRKLSTNPDLLPHYFMHYWIGRLRAKCFSRLPDWTEKHRGIITELVIWTVCFIVWIAVA
nr:hypothetical protein [Candidatus Sigynarchaeota archaeon]